MSFSENIIEVLDAVCNKLGIAIDWTGANVMPYIQQLSTKIVNYELYTSIAWLLFAVIILVIGIIFFIRGKKDWKDGYFSSSIAIGCACITIFIVIAGIQIGDIITALTLPEKTILEFINGVMYYYS